MSATSSGVREISDRFVADYAAADPTAATYLGIAGYDEQLTDYSPEGYAGRADLARSALNAMRESRSGDDTQRLAKAVFEERVGLMLEIHDAGLDGDLNVIASPVQGIRGVFDLMPSGSAQDWATIAARLAAVPWSLASFRASVRRAVDRGRPPALRQVQKVAEQCAAWSGAGGTQSFFHQLVLPARNRDDLVPALLRDLEHRAQAAAEAYAALGGYLRTEIAPRARASDAAGPDVYRLMSRDFLGAKIDLAEAYEWGWEEFFRIEGEMKFVAERIKPGATLAEAAKALDADFRYQIAGQDAFAGWLQQLSDQAIEELRDVHFDIAEPARRLECKIAPPGGPVGAYYTGPSDDFVRPGRMWWSVPADRQEFTTWREATTVYHEGVPGHHLQTATAMLAESLNQFQRLMCWVPGHGEGWALYAERLMRELGYLDDEGLLLGMLDAQLFRAARVVVDLGMHLELPIPAGADFHDGQRWTPELGLRFMLERTISDPDHVHDEIDRYLGWPAQAISYKLGERLWLAAREESRRRAGADFDLKAFHTQALRMGSMGLDTLREQLATL